MSTLVRPKYLTFVITEDMIKAGLKGNDLVVYAFIEYKSNNSISGLYDGGIHEMSRLLQLTEMTLFSVIKRLMSKGIIEKGYYQDGNKCRRCTLKPTYV